jgi:hypothetical protein
METDTEETIYKRIVNICLKNPKVTGTIITVFALIFFGAIIYFPSKLDLKNNENQTPAKNSLNFNTPSDSPQNQSAVQGASTQYNGPEEQSASNSPSQEISPTVSASTSAQTVTTTPTTTPVPTAVPTTPTPTADPTPTAGSGPTSTPTPTSTPEITPTESPTPTPTPSE